MRLDAIDTVRETKETIWVEVAGDEPKLTFDGYAQVRGLVFAPWVGRDSKIRRAFRADAVEPAASRQGRARRLSASRPGRTIPYLAIRAQETLMTSIQIPDFVTVVDRDRPLGKLALIACDLLNGEADGLPAPWYLEIWGHSQEIELGFSGTPDTFHAMAAWADRFGATLTAEQAEHNGQPYVRCTTRFIYQG